MTKIVKRNMRSLVFLLMIAIAATGLSGALSFAAPTAGQANDNKARTKPPQRGGTSPTKRVVDKCRRQCFRDYKDCLGNPYGAEGAGRALTCPITRDECLANCEYEDSSGAKPPKRIKARPRTPRPPTP